MLALYDLTESEDWLLVSLAEAQPLVQGEAQRQAAEARLILALFIIPPSGLAMLSRRSRLNSNVRPHTTHAVQSVRCPIHMKIMDRLR